MRKSRTLRFCSTLISLSIILAIAAITIPVNVCAESAYGFRVRLSTTSAWTEIEFGEAKVTAFEEEIVKTSGTKDLRVNAGNDLAIKKGSSDDSLVVVDYIIYLKNLDKISLNVSISKGGRGYTKLKFYRLEDRKSPFLTLTNEESAHGDKESEKQSLIPTSTLPEVELKKGGKLEVEKKVLAFYYPWYGSPEGPTGRWHHWRPRNSYSSPHEPKAGYYDSLSTETIKRHVKAAKKNGIDGFIASWWGSKSFNGRSFTDRAFAKLLKISEQKGFKVTIYFEEASSKRQIVSNLSYIFENYAGSPAFLKVKEKPAIFFYSRVTQKFGPSVWLEAFSKLKEKGMEGFFIGDGLSSGILKAFDGFHTYNPIKLPVNKLTEKYDLASFRADTKGKLFAATVTPGYNDKLVRNRKSRGFLKKRKNGKLYRRFWKAAISSSPDWILVTSFNEWHEATEIEPSEEFGDKYLELTEKFAKKWKREGP